MDKKSKAVSTQLHVIKLMSNIYGETVDTEF